MTKADHVRLRPEWLAELRQDAAEGFAAFDRGEGVAMTPDELMDGIEGELCLQDPIG